MFRHVVVFRCKPGTSDQQMDAIERGLTELPARPPEMRSYAYGRDVGMREGNGDFAVVAEFDDVPRLAGLRAGRGAPARDRAADRPGHRRAPRGPAPSPLIGTLLRL